MNESSSACSAHRALLDVIRDEFGRVAYSQKTHQKMIDRLNCALVWEKRVSAALMVLTAGNTIAVLVSDERIAEWMAVILSALALGITVYGLSRTREKLVDQHRATAQALWIIRERYVHLICDFKSGSIAAEEARAQRDALTRETAVVYSSAPDTDANAYAAAQKALRKDEELTFSEEELDIMLPAACRNKVPSTTK